MAAAHLGEGRVALRGGRVPVEAVPFGTQDLAERIARRKADADTVGALLLQHRRSEILWLTDTHEGRKLKVGAGGAQGRGLGRAPRRLSCLMAVPTLGGIAALAGDLRHGPP